MPYHFLFSTAEHSPSSATSTDWSRHLTRMVEGVTSCLRRQSVGSATMTSQTWRMTWPTCGRPAVTSGESYAFCVQGIIFFTVWEIATQASRKKLLNLFTGFTRRVSSVLPTRPATFSSVLCATTRMTLSKRWSGLGSTCRRKTRIGKSLTGAPPAETPMTGNEYATGSLLNPSLINLASSFHTTIKLCFFYMREEIKRKVSAEL